MKIKFKTSLYLFVLSLAVSMSACSGNSELVADSSINPPVSQATILLLDVYKSPSCGCCVKWISHLETNDIKAKTHHPDDMGLIKRQHSITSEHQSCHTAVNQDGYVFEGHVPAKFIKQFLADVPENTIGLSVPGMPLGSPGMEVGDKFQAYSILLLHKDGSSSIYAEIKHALEQY